MEGEKRVAVQKEDYDAAERKKKQMDEYRTQTYQASPHTGLD